MARASMSELIEQVRSLIGDRAGTEQVFSDNQVEQALDVHRWMHRGESLSPIPSIINGITEYREWVSEESWWENDATLMNAAWATITPTTAYPLQGRWVFSGHQAVVMISGQVYDVYGASADLLEMWAALSAEEYDVVADGASLHRSQKREALEKIAAVYRGRQRLVLGKQVRSDLY